MNPDRRLALHAFGIPLMGAGLLFVFPTHPGIGWGLIGLGLSLSAYAELKHRYPALDVALARIGPALMGRAERAPRDLIPLAEAAQQLLEKAPRSALVMVGRRMNPDPSDLLDYLAIHMVGRELPVWGKLPPSRVYELIEFLNMRAGHITHGATTLTWSLDERPGYVDLAVRRSDLKRLWTAFLANIG